MKIELYANMGELGHEYSPVYARTAGEYATKVEVEIPDRYEAYRNETDDIIVNVPYKGEVMHMYVTDALNQMVGFRKACKITEVVH